MILPNLSRTVFLAPPWSSALRVQKRHRNSAFFSPIYIDLNLDPSINPIPLSTLGTISATQQIKDFLKLLCLYSIQLLLFLFSMKSIICKLPGCVWQGVMTHLRNSRQKPAILRFSYALYLQMAWTD